MEQRSTFVTVLGWIFVVLSGLSLLAALLCMFMPVGKPLADMLSQAGVSADDTVYVIVHGIFFVMAAISVWVLISSIGLVMRKNWARISLMLMLLFGLGWNLFYVFTGVIRALISHGMPAHQDSLSGVFGVMAVIGVVSIALFGWILHKLNGERVKKEFLPEPKPNP